MRGHLTQQVTTKCNQGKRHSSALQITPSVWFLWSTAKPKWGLGSHGFSDDGRDDVFKTMLELVTRLRHYFFVKVWEKFYKSESFFPTNLNLTAHRLGNVEAHSYRRHNVKVKVQRMWLRRAWGELLKQFMVHQIGKGKWALASVKVSAELLALLGVNLSSLHLITAGLTASLLFFTLMNN